jgi:protein involved in polysaccharide export with SLBB domain
MVKITLGIEKYKYPKNNPKIEYANTVFSPNNPFVTIPINPWRPANIIIKKPITTPGKASGKVSIDKIISLPGKIFRTRNSPAVVETIRAENVTVIESSKVANKLSKCLGLLTIEKYAERPASLLPPIIAN